MKKDPRGRKPKYGAFLEVLDDNTLYTPMQVVTATLPPTPEHAAERRRVSIALGNRIRSHADEDAWVTVLGNRCRAYLGSTWKKLRN